MDVQVNKGNHDQIPRNTGKGKALGCCKSLMPGILARLSPSCVNVDAAFVIHCSIYRVGMLCLIRPEDIHAIHENPGRRPDTMSAVGHISDAAAIL
nr:hypothetical protein CFP56_33624 [Quercus suber]